MLGTLLTTPHTAGPAMEIVADWWKDVESTGRWTTLLSQPPMMDRAKRLRKLLGSWPASIMGQKAENPVAIVMGYDQLNRYYGWTFLRSSGKRQALLFDAWPDRHDAIIEALNLWPLDRLWVSSQQATEILNERLGRELCAWLPEGLPSGTYAALPAESRTIDFLQFGRRYDRLHEKIVDPLRDANVSYLFEQAPGQLVFPDQATFLRELGNTKICLCVPRSLTHSETAQGIETMTVRYLYAMASGCLPFGHAPAEMVELFGYNPVVEADWDHPFEQIQDLLAHYGRYAELIERNRKAVLESHMFLNRWPQVEAYLKP